MEIEKTKNNGNRLWWMVTSEMWVDQGKESWWSGYLSYGMSVIPSHSSIKFGFLRHISFLDWKKDVRNVETGFKNWSFNLSNFLIIILSLKITIDDGVFPW